MKNIPGFVFLTLMLSYVSCGGYNSSSNSYSPPPQQQEQSSGEFEANLIPVNSSIVNNPVSTNRFRIIGDQVNVQISASGLSPNTIQKQHIHSGRACPTIADDTNRDGFVDGLEAQNRTGKVLIPLDGDINSQLAGASTYPVTDGNGSYNYSQSASLTNLLSDLTSPDTDPNDEFIKLTNGEVLNIDGVVFEIHGIPSSVNLPTTVGALPGMTPHQSFPVACGLLQSVNGSSSSTTTGGSTSGGNSGNGGLSCRLDLQILCPAGQRDGCEIGQTQFHQCVTPIPVACSESLQIVCPPGFIDGCLSAGTQIHQCIRTAR